MHADRARFDQLMARLKAAGGEEDRWVYAGALSAGRDEARAKELMAAALAGITTPNVAFEVPGMVGSHSPIGELAYNFTLEHWDELAKIAGARGTYADADFPGAASCFRGPRGGQLNEVTADQSLELNVLSAHPFD